MRSTLFLKIFVLIFFTMTIIFVFFTYQFIFTQKESILGAQQIKAKSIAQNIYISNSDAMVVEDEITLLESVQDFVSLNEDLESITITREKGSRIIVKKDNWSLVEREQLGNVNIARDFSYSIFDSDEYNKKIFKYIFPVYFNDIIWGDLILELDLVEYQKQVENIDNNAITLGVILLFTSLLISYTLAKMITAPIIQFNSITEEISKGNLSMKLDIKTNDEIGKLAQNFNKMVTALNETQKRLRESHSKLEERVEQRTKELNDLNENLEKRVDSEIRKRQEQEQLLIQQSKLASMGEMIGNIAHQWRQPLNALSLVMQNVQLAYELNELDDEFMEKSVKKVNLLANNMSKTIDDFRNFFKPNKEKEVFVLNDIVKKTLDIVDSTFEHHNIKIIQKFESKIKVFGFSNEFSQTILNIMNNSKDAFSENSIPNAKVTITVKNDKDYGIVSIEDNAGGIPQDIINKVFEPYFTTKEEGKGTGIGLYMSKIIVEQNMEGKLSVRNIENGAQFIVKIPLYKEFKIEKS
ncbi:ATP-binding protein [Arcobacter arenosus]|nr:ATP-binding protein [Arcobacter arenosus]